MMEKRILKIERVLDGYIFTDSDDFGDEVNVIEEDDNDELAGIEKLLWRIVDALGFYGSKHDAERIRIIRQKRED